MRKFALYLFALSFISVGVGCNNGKEEHKHHGDSVAATANDTPLTVSANSDKLNMAFEGLLNEYTKLHDAFVEWDTAQVNAAAASVNLSIDSFPSNEIKADDAIVATAKDLLSNMKDGASAIVKNNTIEKKRRAFASLSDNFYNLTRTIKYDRATIYRVTCPMAFNDEEEANWISKDNKVLNPYLGKKHPKYKAGMLECGEVSDSLKYASPK